jgi:hypothetical protein
LPKTIKAGSDHNPVNSVQSLEASNDIDTKNVFNNLRSFQQYHTSQPVDADTLPPKASL